MNDETPEVPLANEYLDERVFKFQVYFWNNDGQIIKLFRGSIDELVIQDSILDWYHTGYMTFKNPKNVFERASKRYVGREEIDTLPYRFRNDGRDYIYIEIDVPVEDDILSSESLENEVYTIRLLCSIYRSEDVSGKSPNEKLKRVYFRDYRKQLMSEKNAYWSTATAIARHRGIDSYWSTYLVDDKKRSIYSGDAIKDIITECLKTSTTTPEFEDDFSKGGERIFYTSSASAKVDDDLEYILHQHVHDNINTDPCILRVNRFTDKWSLLPISEYFNRAYLSESEMPGQYQLDRFFLADEAMPAEISGNILRTPAKFTAMNNFFTDYNLINDFQFVETSAIDNSELINTTAVHIYNNKTKQFNVQYENSDIESVRDYMVDTVLHPLLADSAGAVSNIVLNKSLSENKNIKHLFTSKASKVGESLAGRNKTLMAAIFTGNSINFNVKGFPSRQAGRFISIDRDNAYSDNSFDDKLLGQYLTTSVTHTINAQGYNNEILAVKPYTFKDQQFNEDVE